MKIGFPPAAKVFPGQKPWFEDQVLQAGKEFAIKVSDIVKKMRNQVPECLPRLYVFLATYMAVAAME